MDRAIPKRGRIESDNRSERKPVLKSMLQLAALAFVIIMFVNVLYSSAMTMMKIEEKKTELIQQINDYSLAAAKLEQELELSQSDAYIEKEARAQGFIKDNEIVFKIKR